MDHLPAELVDFVASRQRLLVLSGAGCSTESGIPDYRDRNGEWKRRQPVQYREFVSDARVRQRYWARSLVGWRRMDAARPNDAHRALARLEEAGRIHWLITQNVDGLHQAAGSRRVIDLHGRLDCVVCLQCKASVDRRALQAELEGRNPAWAGRPAATAPDGDADLEVADFSGFEVPECAACGGMLKPAVVFFGEAVPRWRSEAAERRFDEADGLLVVGSSLMVWSGYRFARAARARGLPAAIVNLGRSRADDIIPLRVAAPCGNILLGLTRRIQ